MHITILIKPNNYHVTSNRFIHHPFKVDPGHFLTFAMRAYVCHQTFFKEVPTLHPKFVVSLKKDWFVSLYLNDSSLWVSKWVVHLDH